MQKPQPLDRERAYQGIAELIAKSKLDPGEPVTERGLAEQLGIGRTPIREAIRELVRDGALEVHPARGTCVRANSLQDLGELFDVRHALEGLAVYRAAEFGPTEKLSAYGHRLRSVSRRFNHAKAFDLGVDFHVEIFRAARNRLLIDTYMPIKLRYRLASAIVQTHDHEWIRRSVDEHLGILEAIEERDPALAQRRMQDHLTHSFQCRLQIFTRLYQAPPIAVAPRASPEL